jgi:hypothetical protein
MALLEQCKIALRLSHSELDTEVQELIDAAKLELQLVGVINFKDTDPLIVQAIKTYCKAHFGYSNPEAERFKEAFESLKNHLSLVGEYTIAFP